MFIPYAKSVPCSSLFILSRSFLQPVGNSFLFSHIRIIVCKTYFIDILCCTLSLKVVCKVVEECKKRGTIGQTNSADTLEENNKVIVFKGLFCQLLSRKQQM